ncbi:amino acid permease [Novosphingobium beihaiensis]|uniref:Amino acid permease n=1 Tax=Novosphingobium beihaiensis TaxID=2930389 RepID=A0ABT0BLJ8_9SPHN|nr:amino acid permease [Novosphingobium beihaiensis]MCJ2185835.1 amino acid permease [Novosphingobium beihaiensis]
MTQIVELEAGHPEEHRLSHSLESRHVSMIAIGGIIGAGLFVGSSTAIAQVGPAVIVSYALAGALILMVMRMLSEMASLHPGAGSFTELVREGLGERAGFVCGWLYWYFWVVVVAIEAIAGAVILASWIAAPVWLIGMVLLALMTGVNLLSARSYGEFEFWFSLAKVVAIVGFIVIAGLWAFGVTSPASPAFANLTGHDGFAPNGWGAVLAGVTTVIFALTGAEIATIAAAESHEPARTIARITGSVALRILLFYLLSIALIVAVIPWTSVVEGHSPFASALDSMNIPHAGDIMNAVILVAVLSCLNSGMYVTSRVLFVLSEKGNAPKALVTLNHRHVPVRATLTGSLFAYLALAASVISPQVVFSFLVNASGALMLFIYLLVCLAQLRMRAQTERDDPDQLVIRMWFHPYGSIASALGIVVVLVAMGFKASSRAELVSSLVLLAVTFALSFYRPGKPGAVLAAAE